MAVAVINKEMSRAQGTPSAWQDKWLPGKNPAGNFGGGQRLDAGAGSGLLAAVLAIGPVEYHVFGPRPERRPAAGVHGFYGWIKSQHMPAQRRRQMQRPGTAGHQPVGGGNKGQKLGQRKLPGKVGGYG